jgi:signal transduction histidine kinase
MAQSVENKIKIGVGIVLAALIANAALSYRATRILINNDRWVSHTHQVLTALEVVLSTLKDAETGERGFIITGSNEYLEPYRSAVRRIDDDLQTLKELTADNPQQQERIPILQQRIAERLSILKSGIDFKTAGNTEAAQALIASGAGKRSMDDLRRLINEMETGENRLLAKRIEDSGKSQSYTFLTFVTANLIAGSLLLGTAIVVTKGVRARQHAESERSELLAAERASREQAEAANRSKDEFLAILSHELKTPLTAVHGWVQLLKTREVDRPTMEKALAVIDRNLRLQNQLIDDLLNVSKIISGKLQIHQETVNVLDSVNAAIETVRPSAEAKDISIRLESDTDLPAISADPSRLQQIVWNLLSNGVKFTPKGGNIVVKVSRTTRDLRIAVRDSGEGISPDFLPQVFNRFSQADSSKTRVHGGLGLGLALVRQLVELHGGTVSAESAGLGKGSTFAVTFPLPDGPLEQSPAHKISLPYHRN